MVILGNDQIYYHFLSVYRGGKYSEEDAKAVMVQILSVVSFCHLQGVVHRDLKPEVTRTSHSMLPTQSPKITILKSSLHIIFDNFLSVFLVQNFLFTSKDENSTLKAIDFGLSDFVKPG